MLFWQYTLSVVGRLTGVLAERYDMASKAGSVKLNLTDNVTFKAKARSKSWKDTPTVEAAEGREATEAEYHVTNNFVATCGLWVLELLTGIISPRKIGEMPFVDVCVAIEGFLDCCLENKILQMRAKTW